MANMTIDELADVVKGEFNRVDERFDNLSSDVSILREDMADIKKRINKVEATMVTKDYLDEKLADLKGDMVVLIRKEDNKFKTLVDILTAHKVISDEEAEKILTMEPFAKVVISK